ncbi:uncharacterized protein [Montipora capricornis]|uniref:uncharacterized protein n=1 Tax=Montipora capricornis TaxID=246305 RepID=UPI0035F14623
MKTTLFTIISVCLCATAANVSQGNGDTNVNQPTVKPNSVGKVLVQQLCTSGAGLTELKSMIKQEFQTMKKELIHEIEKKDSKDPWIKMNTAPVCFGAKGDQFGKFFVPIGGRLASIKLVHFYGYVTCAKSNKKFWSYWGCSTYVSSLKEMVNIVITNSSNHILLPSSQFMRNNNKWSSLQGYNSFSPEIVLSVFSDPSVVVKGQELRLWFGEDMVNSFYEGDNDGKSCCDVYARLV